MLDKSLKFLKSLARNNNRDWFEKNKAKFLEAKAEFESFVTDLLEEMESFDASLNGLEAKKLIFRIYRDVRFSKDKRPYKTNFGAAFSASGKGLGRPGYYLHIEPGNKSFIAGGLYMPEPQVLTKVRQEIDYNGDKLKAIMQEKKFKKLFGDFWDEDKLKRPPKGYDEEHTYIEWLKLKSFIVTTEIKDPELNKKNVKKSLATSFKTLKPLNDFLNQAID
ncbi:MAG TPA: DUF2461 domain-containing protein [Cyclobacteriaceae bacterium]|mgnify:CR=1 FL=1|nr:DUF2461 domain-containing protein [Cyclobacteriaceae bacterium]